MSTASAEIDLNDASLKSSRSLLLPSSYRSIARGDGKHAMDIAERRDTEKILNAVSLIRDKPRIILPLISEQINSMLGENAAV